MKAFILYIKNLDGTEETITVLDYVEIKEINVKRVKKLETKDQKSLLEKEPPKR